MFHRRVVALIDIGKNDSARAGIIGNNDKAQAIGAALRRKSRASGSIAQIAQIAQLAIRRRIFLPVRVTRAAESRAQRQARRKSPGNSLGFFSGKEKWASHRRSSYVCRLRIV